MWLNQSCIPKIEIMAVRIVEGPITDFVKTCVDVPRFLACCRECPNYNRRWSCPPYEFSVESIWNQFTDILLYEEKVFVSPEIRDKSFNHEEINELSRALLAPAKRQMTDTLLTMEKEYPGSRALFAGTCELCENCDKEQGIPCGHPEIMRYSIEALGGNVAKAVQIYFDDTIHWAKDGRLPDYYILLGGLLKH